jgi:hypothetical protein
MAIRFAGKNAKPKPGSRPAPKPGTAKRKAVRPPRKRAGLATKAVEHALVSLQPPHTTTIEEIGKLNTLAEFQQAGLVIMRRTVDAHLWLAELIWQGKQRLTPEEFEQLQRNLSVAATTALQYITTAKSERIRKLRDQEADLPASAHTLYLLAAMDDAEYKAFLKDHHITKDLTTTEVRQFRVWFKDQAAIASLPKTTRAAQEKAAEDAANEATAPVEDGADPNEFAQAPEVGDEVRGEDGYATFKELGQGLLEITSDSIQESFRNIDADEAETRFAFTTKVAEHIADLHKLVSDLQFALSNP